MLSLDKAQIILVIAMRPCQPFLCIARNARALSGCWMLPVPPNYCSFSASGVVHTLHLRAFLSPFDVMWAGKNGCTCRYAGKIELNEQASNRRFCHTFAPQGYAYKAFVLGLHKAVSHITGAAPPWVPLCHML